MFKNQFQHNTQCEDDYCGAIIPTVLQFNPFQAFAHPEISFKMNLRCFSNSTPRFPALSSLACQDHLVQKPVIASFCCAAVMRN